MKGRITATEGDESEARREEFAAHVADVHEAVDRVRSSLDDLAAFLERSSSRAYGGEPVSAIALDLLAAGAIEARVNAREEMLRYESAMQSLRGLLIRVLIDDQGLTLAEVGRRLGLSPQMVRRLYKSGAGDESPPRRR